MNHDRTSSPASQTKNSWLTLILLVLCFALWGLVNNMSDNLVPAFQRIFTMDQSRAVLVQVSFCSAA